MIICYTFVDMKILEEIRAFDELCKKSGLPEEKKIEWGVNNNVGTWIIGEDTEKEISLILEEYKPRQVLELGTSVGYSAIFMADIIQAWEGQLTSVEKTDFKFREAQSNVAKSGLQNIDLIFDDATLYLEELDVVPDLAFLDANKSGYLPQARLLEAQMQPGSVLLADNVIDMADRLKDFLEYMRESDAWEVMMIETADGLLKAVRTED